MDTESLKSLGWLLVWGGLFFVMMRYGCGAHMMGGHRHGGHGGHGDATPGGGDKDPVCGMTVNSSNAAAAAVRDGKTYLFCSASCRDKFEQAPDKYLRPAAKGEHHG
jgi:YHS domain-containing protein